MDRFRRTCAGVRASVSPFVAVTRLARHSRRSFSDIRFAPVALLAAVPLALSVASLDSAT
jgi:hypothetical protein